MATLTKKQSQIFSASVLGTRGYNEGLKAPAQCKDLMQMLTGRNFGHTPEGEASTIELLTAWNKNWQMQHRRKVAEGESQLWESTQFKNLIRP